MAEGDVGILAFKMEADIFFTNQVGDKRAKFGILLSKGTLQLEYHSPLGIRFLLITDLFDKELVIQFNILFLQLLEVSRKRGNNR